ncbi:hypothetical protein ETAA8_26760 [Anatilimnocola aggregata]|uniref:Uncharacterized protein n=1 Tax=Anatilimnocola aggregata TaxID=2528021 RepID=A0A517YBH3_9BACT|nr:hypothetical protein [Anatilimnocola aggregata]QDU27588.1 hypothetical protein ETAA8_26760 [Anatilimnocola aggregata]
MLPELLVAQDNYQAPISADAKPLRVEGSAEAPLRWKARPIASLNQTQHAAGTGPITRSAIGSGVVQASHTSEAQPAGAPAGAWNKMRIDSYVTPVQHSTAVDPFRDPFNDRHATRKASALQLQGAEQTVSQPGFLQPPGSGGLGGTGNPNAPGANPNAPSANPAGPTPGFSPFQPVPSPAPAPTPDPNNLRPMTDPGIVPQEAPQPLTPPAFNPNQLAPEADRSNPAPLNRAVPYGARPQMVEGQPCEKRTYDELNCCDADSNCRSFVNGLLRDRLNTISLDITPRFMPDKDLQEDQQQREARMVLSGTREWHDRRVRFEERENYEPLAKGQLLDLQRGRAIIGNEAGEVVARVPLTDLSEDDLCFISGWWKLPAECAIASNQQIDNYSRGWMPSTLNWHASALCHKPLYFEQVQHERYGHSAGPFRQPWIDGAHFFGSFLLLPYQMALDAPWECEYALGYYRPGSCAPYQIPPFPFSPRAAMAQAGFVVGGIYIIP